MVEILVEFARWQHITQIFLARTRSRSWTLLPARSLHSQVIALAQDIQVILVADRKALKH